MHTVTKLALAATLLASTFAFGQAVKITKGPVVEHTDATGAVIAWSTNASSATIVRYGTDPNHLDRTAEMPWGGMTHRVTVKDLQPGTTYYFQADSSQGKGTGTTAISPTGKFTTSGESARNHGNDHAAGETARSELKLTNGPVIEHVGDTTATVAWSTDLPSSSIVKYGTDPRNLNETAEQPWGATTHRVEIKNLKPNTRYYFSVHSAQGKNAPGQALDTPPQPFTTSAGERARRQ